MNDINLYKGFHNFDCIHTKVTLELFQINKNMCGW